jgi:hypothetical protein
MVMGYTDIMESIGYQKSDLQPPQPRVRFGTMIYKFCQLLEDIVKPKSRYFMAKRVFGVAPQQYDRYRDEKANARSMPLEAIAKARFNSGLTWEKFGKIFDDCFLKKQK